MLALSLLNGLLPAEPAPLPASAGCFEPPGAVGPLFAVGGGGGPPAEAPVLDPLLEATDVEVSPPQPAKTSSDSATTQIVKDLYMARPRGRMRLYTLSALLCHFLKGLSSKL